MDNTDGGYEERSDHYPQRGGLHAIVGPGFLTEQNVQCPADPCAQGITGAYKIDAGGRFSRRYQ
ncbi:hypothetical protein D9M71_661050 [compost metagenome]